MTDRHDARAIHFDHVGSLLRPRPLFAAREKLLGAHDHDHNLGAHDNAELRAIEDEHVRAVVAMQEAAGLRFVTDGDYRRRSWWTDFFTSLEGVRVTYAGQSSLSMINARGETRPLPTVDIGQPIRWRGSINVAGFRFLQSVTRQAPKVTLPPPTMVHFQRGDRSDLGVYGNDADRFWDDLIRAWRQEIAALAEAGCRQLQIDECNMLMLCDERNRDYVRSRGEDPEQLLDQYAWAMNEILRDRPRDMFVRMHMCRGNLTGFWSASGGYGPIAERVFNRVDADAYLMEYDSERAGDFSPLAHLPKGKLALLGLVTTKRPDLEDPDALRRRIDEASRFVDVSQLGLCPQCGFSSNVFGNPLTEEDQRRKLALVVETATKIWG